MFSESCNDRRRKIGYRMAADRFRDRDNSAGIGDNVAGIGDNVAGIGDNSTGSESVMTPHGSSISPWKWSHAKLRPEWWLE